MFEERASSSALREEESLRNEFDVVLKRTDFFPLPSLGGLLAAAAADLGRGRLLGQKDGLDVGQDAALRDRDAGEELVEFLVVADGELEVARDDARLLVVARRVAGQLEHLGRQVLHHRRQVDGRPGTDALGVVALAQQTVDSADGELEASAAGPALRLRLDFTALSASGHGR